MRPALPHEEILAAQRDWMVVQMVQKPVIVAAEGLLGGRAAHAVRPELELLTAAAAAAAATLALPEKVSLGAFGRPLALLLPAAAQRSLARTPGQEAAGVVHMTVTPGKRPRAGGGGGGRAWDVRLTPRWVVFCLLLAPAAAAYARKRSADPLSGSATSELVRVVESLRAGGGAGAAASVRRSAVSLLLLAVSGLTRASRLAVSSVSLGARALSNELSDAAGRAIVESQRYRLRALADLAGRRMTSSRGRPPRPPARVPPLVVRGAWDNEAVAALTAALRLGSGDGGRRYPADVSRSLAQGLAVAVRVTGTGLLGPLRLPEHGGPGAEASRAVWGPLVAWCGLVWALWRASWLVGSVPFPTPVHSALGALPAQVRRLSPQSPVVSPLRVVGVMVLVRLGLSSLRAAVALLLRERRLIVEAAARQGGDRAGRGARQAANAAAAESRAAGLGACAVEVGAPATRSDEVELADVAPGRACPVCMGPRRETAALPCGHMMCWGCGGRWCRERGQCAVCRAPAGPQSLVRLWGMDG